MKKILHVSYSMDTGGGPLTIKRIVEDLPVHVYFVSGNPGVYMDHFQKTLPPSHILKLRGPNLIMNLILLVRFCTAHAIDVLHVHGRGAASFARFVKLFRPRIKVVYTPNGFFPRSLHWSIRWFYVFLERVLLSLTDLVFFVSPSEKQTFASSVGLAISNPKFLYIQNYINANLTQLKPPIEYSHPMSIQPRFLFIGRLSMQKGVDILMDSLRKLDGNFQVSIVGYGEMEDFVRTEIANGLQNKIFFIGKQNEAFRIMPNFDALLLPSRFEGLPFTVLEAMLYRLPLIVTPCNGTKDLVANENGYVAKGIDAESFAEAIKSFQSDYRYNQARIQQMIEMNYHKVTTEYSFAAVEEKLRLLYA